MATSTAGPGPRPATGTATVAGYDGAVIGHTTDEARSNGEGRTDHDNRGRQASHEGDVVMPRARAWRLLADEGPEPEIGGGPKARRSRLRSSDCVKQSFVRLILPHLCD